MKNWDEIFWSAVAWATVIVAILWLIAIKVYENAM